MGLDLTESAIDEFYGMVSDIGNNLAHINKILEHVAVALASIAETLKDTGKKGGGA